ncbi:MAG: 4-(cytidine 5'-diphospho)-2-C-methyl-D-erythritol kinase [Litorimonas sp.]
MLCRAKVNLTLHVGAAIEAGLFKGYHPVESLVVFADFGDTLTFAPSPDASHEIAFEGPFAYGLTDDTGNSVRTALELCQAHAQSVTVQKVIPVAAGLGGGTADAAGVLRKFDPDGAVSDLEIGADGAVCRLSRTAMMEGIGERVTPQPRLGRIAAVLVNPGVQLSTGRIFSALDAQPRPQIPRTTSRDGTLLDRAMSGTNEMDTAAIIQEPTIRDVLDAIENQADCRLARMSGSGATCFGLFDRMEPAMRAADALSARGWWAVPTLLGDPD